MARPTREASKIKQLEAENNMLKAENKKLKNRSQSNRASRTQGWKNILRRVGIIFFTALAAALLLTGNIIFWTGNTIVKNDRFDASTQPIIRNTQVQQAIASYTTQQIYSNVDVDQYITNVLPPRADFLAPTIASQLKSQTNNVLQKVLARPQFQNRWNESLSRSHARFINTVGKYGGDGVIDLNELFQEVSGNLQGTKLSFLAGKQLPAKVGSIQIISGEQIKILHNVINNIDLWRILTILLFLISAAISIWLSRRRRRAVIALGLILSFMMLATLVGLRVAREIIAGDVNPTYADAVRQIIQIIFHPLVVQTVILLIVSLLVSLIAWLSGGSRSANAVKARTSELLAGQLHSALFSHENSLTIWTGKNKRFIQWSILIVIVIVDLIVRLTPNVLIVSLIVLVLLALIVEALAAQPDVRKA